MKKMIVMILAVALILTNLTGVFSASADDGNDTETVCTKGFPIGSMEDQDGYLIEDDEPTRGLPFTMSARKVYNLLTTYGVSGKSFTGGAFDGLAGEGLLIEGTLSNSVGGNIRYGACSYDVYDDTFYTVLPLTIASGEPIEAFIPKQWYFSNSITYYGHVTNYTGVGYAYGDLSFSVSTDP